MNDIRSALSKLLGRGAPVSEKTKAPAATLSGRLLAAIGAKPEAKPYKIMVRNAAGELVSVPATREEMLAYANRESAWRRIA